MSIHTVIREFTEKYDANAMTSIDKLPSRIGLNASMIPFKVFNLKETCEAFSNYLKGYCDYMKLNKDNDKKTSREAIKASMESLITDPDLFKECTIKYNTIPEFVKDYLVSVQSLVETVDSIKEDMELGGVGLEYVGDVNEYADQFISKLNEKFDPIMDNILWASGYNGSKRKPTPINIKTSNTVTFL